jgi:nucleoside-diphosphate-sugar epimerase
MIGGVRVLVIGGSGYVGGLLLPELARHHEIRVLDPRPPAGGYEHVAGDATDPAVLRTAVDGVDALVHGAMGRQGNERAAFDVNVTSVHLALSAAHAAGVRHAVHLSSLSVYADVVGRHLPDESVPTDATDLYGLTKRLGEQVCEAAAHRFGLSVNVLRLAFPTPDARWPAWARHQPPERVTTPDGVPVDATAASDLGRAVLAALDHRNGFHIFTISGDRSARRWSTAKAQTVLGWEPIFGIRT